MNQSGFTKKQFFIRNQLKIGISLLAISTLLLTLCFYFMFKSGKLLKTLKIPMPSSWIKDPIHKEFELNLFHLNLVMVQQLVIFQLALGLNHI